MKAHDEYSQFTIDLFEDLTGLDWAEAEHDEGGTYFSLNHWVSAKGIVNMLKAMEDYFAD